MEENGSKFDSLRDNANDELRQLKRSVPARPSAFCELAFGISRHGSRKRFTMHESCIATALGGEHWSAFVNDDDDDEHAEEARLQP